MVVLTPAEAHILMEEEKVQSQTNANLHGKWIKLNPDTFKVLVLFIQELIHPGDLLDELLVGAGHRFLIKLEQF